uniref:Uncharacterized protein n=1 Tax=Arundo donax TaxID=35708 RepID=A0A0A9T9L6_ARUDO
MSRVPQKRSKQLLKVVILIF